MIGWARLRLQSPRACLLDEPMTALDQTLERTLVSLQVDRTGLTPRQQAIEIRPGMQAQVKLNTGGKTVLQYLLTPLHKSQEAFREP